jgi:PAS domain S-box-containing protein
LGAVWSTLDKGDTSTLAVCLRDVVALSTLPALWSEAEPLRIAESLAAALSTTLSAQLVYVAVSDGEGRPFIVVAQTDRYETSHFIAEKVGPTLLEWARTRDPDELLMLADPLGRGQLRVATRPLGHHAELGLIAAGFADDGAPTDVHHLTLSIGASQGATGVKNALLFKSLRESEERFRTLVDASSQIVWTTAADGSVIEDSPSWRAYTGQTREEWLGSRWIEALHPEDRHQTVEIWRKAIESGTPVEAEYRLRHCSGEWRHAAVRAVPRRDSTNTVQEWVGMIADVTARRKAEKSQELLIGELNHRVKNTLAVIQSIAQKTAQHARTPSEFVTSFNGRLHSLSRVHTQLSEANWQRADLHDLIQDQLLQNGSDESGLTSSGPKVELDPQVATHLGMVLHELNTNARKYGAFSSPTGKVILSWIVTDALLRLTWTEKGGPPVETPITRGFGTSLITQTTAAYGGSAQMHCTSEGVTWEICWPISSSARE